MVCVLLAADFLLRNAAENAAADLIDEQIPHRVDPEVGLGGFPFLLSVLSGHFDEVTISVPEAAEGSLVVEDIRLTLRDVDLEALEVLGGRGNLTAREMRGRGFISEGTVNDVVRGQGADVDVAIEDGRVSVSANGVTSAATAVVAGNRLLIKAGEVLGPIEIPLPVLLPEIQFSTLTATPGRLVLGVVGSRVRIRT